MGIWAGYGSSPLTHALKIEANKMLGHKALPHHQAKATAQLSLNPSSASDPNLPAPLSALLENNNVHKLQGGASCAQGMP